MVTKTWHEQGNTTILSNTEPLNLRSTRPYFDLFAVSNAVIVSTAWAWEDPHSQAFDTTWHRKLSYIHARLTRVLGLGGEESRPPTNTSTARKASVLGILGLHGAMALAQHLSRHPRTATLNLSKGKQLGVDSQRHGCKRLPLCRGCNASVPASLTALTVGRGSSNGCGEQRQVKHHKRRLSMSPTVWNGWIRSTRLGCPSPSPQKDMPSDGLVLLNCCAISIFLDSTRLSHVALENTLQNV